LKPINDLATYFDLYSEHRHDMATSVAAGEKKLNPNLWLFLQYIALYLGIISKIFLDSLELPEKPPFSKTRLIVALIIATAIFPAVYKKALEDANPGFVQLCVVFAAGLGYKTLIDIK
jgi:hypothetical protein